MELEGEDVRTEPMRNGLRGSSRVLTVRRHRTVTGDAVAFLLSQREEAQNQEQTESSIQAHQNIEPEIWDPSFGGSCSR